jgi:hypothetical protein
MAKRKYAKTYDGPVTRLVCKLSALAVLQFINFINQKSLNHIKFAIAA